MLANLLGRVPSQELRVVLGERVGQTGQYGGASDDPNNFYLPLWGDSCQVVLTYDGAEIIGVERGPALSVEEWERLNEELENSLVRGPQTLGRDFSFNGHRVLGWWRGAQSGVQILPPPANTPVAPVEIADHPFILEFPIQGSDVLSLTNYRRIRDHRRLTLLLNVLLRGGTSLQPLRTDHFWAAVPRDAEHPGNIEIKWVQEFFFSASLGQVVIDELSLPVGSPLDEVESAAYYALRGHDGQGLRVPADLDRSICLYQQLPPAHREKFDRATFWLDGMSRQWTFSMSASFASLVIALEALTKRGTRHPTRCTVCGWSGTHDIPGATEKLRAFFGEYAPGVPHEIIERVIKLRGSILHGGTLMQVDQVRAFGWDPVESRELELVRELATWTKVALRNWLKNPPRVV